MTIKEIIEKCSGLSMAEKRAVSDDYGEVVFFASERETLNGIFDGIFGAPLKPTGTRPGGYHRRLVDEYGGIMQRQKLYKKEFDGKTFIAMFWPWRDGSHITVKIAVLKEVPKQRSSFLGALLRFFR